MEYKKTPTPMPAGPVAAQPQGQMPAAPNQQGTGHMKGQLFAKIHGFNYTGVIGARAPFK